MASAEIQPSESPKSMPYKVVVITGDVRGAGSSAAALITLHGEGAISSRTNTGSMMKERGFNNGNFLQAVEARATSSVLIKVEDFSELPESNMCCTPDIWAL